MIIDSQPSPAHKWAFAAPSRRLAFGWRSQPAVQRVRDATAEIRKIANMDPAPAAAGCGYEITGLDVPAACSSTMDASIRLTNNAMLARRYTWASPLARIYELFPLVCPRYDVEMRIVALIADAPTIHDLLVHLGTCHIRARGVGVRGQCHTSRATGRIAGA